MSKAIIVDDNEMDREAMKILLRREGIEALAFTLPDRLKQHDFESEDISVVFLDLEFPNQNGLQAIQELKTIPALSHVPFIAYTVHTNEQVAVRTAGFEGFLGKPINIAKFSERLQQILSGENVWGTGH